MSVLLEGGPFTGKTALAARLSVESDLPFIRMISPDSMIGKSESQKCDYIQKTFVDSYKSALSIIFIDDLERILEYTPIGPRFSNVLLQTLLVLIRKVPPVAGRRLMVVATTSIAHLLEDMQITQAFNVQLHVCQLQRPEEIRAVLEGGDCGLAEAEARAISDSLECLEKPIGIKQLLNVLEMARAGRANDDDPVDPSHFMECLHTCGF
jgi:vesicle-fusing ATPase